MSEHAVTNSTVSGTTSGVVGIDVSKLKFDVFAMRGATSAATPGAATSGHSKVFENKCAGFAAFTQWLVHKGFEPASTQVCMEATGPYSEQLALALVQTGWQVSVVNPARVKGFAQSQLTRNKTDRADAALLARFCHTMKPDLWEPPTVAVRQLRAWVERCQALKDMKQQEMNRIEALSAGADASVCAPVNKQLSEHVLWLDAAIAKIEADIDRHINNHPDLKKDAALIESIPGIGRTTVAKVLAYAQDVRRFANAKALAAFIGVTPRQRLSGSSVKGRTMMSRTGHQELRRALYMPRMVARRHNVALRAFGDRLAKNGLAPKPVIGAVMRKLVHLIYGVVKSGKPFNADLAASRLNFQDGNCPHLPCPLLPSSVYPTTCRSKSKCAGRPRINAKFEDKTGERLED